MSMVGIIISIVMFITSLNGCLNSCGGVEQSHIMADPDWVKDNPNKEAFEFKCEADYFPMKIFTQIINFTVSDIYLLNGMPTFTNLAQVRANALAKAVNTVRNRINMENSAADIISITCKETFMEEPPTVPINGSCKISRTEINDNESVGVPPVLNPSPSPSSGLFPETDDE